MTASMDLAERAGIGPGMEGADSAWGDDAWCDVVDESKLLAEAG